MDVGARSEQPVHNLQAPVVACVEECKLVSIDVRSSSEKALHDGQAPVFTRNDERRVAVRIHIRARNQ